MGRQTFEVWASTYNIIIHGKIMNSKYNKLLVEMFFGFNEKHTNGMQLLGFISSENENFDKREL